MARTSPLAGAIGLAAALSLTAPAHAASLPEAPVQGAASGNSLVFLDNASPVIGDPQAEVYNWRRCGWRGCYRGWRGGWYGHRRANTGAVLAGAVIIGGIAALASSAANNSRRNNPDVVVIEREVRDDRDDNDRRNNPRSSSIGSGIDNAVSQCLDVIERDVRVDSVNSATRVSSGWIVSGSIFDGSGFRCEIGNDGRISDINYGRVSRSGAVGAGVQFAGQWSDDRYADARASLEEQQEGVEQQGEVQRFAQADTDAEPQPLVPLTSNRLPAYPGGPLPGEE
ncbi:MAG: hypothetical protein AAFR64_04575 [Pseudomonadota bacterium]